ncbi:hypothetical protein EON79_22755, partial [bacterium]
MRARTLLVFTLLLLAVLAVGQTTEQGVARWKGVVQNGRLVLTAEIDKGWHVYSTVPVTDGPFPTEVKATGLKLGTPIDEKGIKKENDPNFGKEVGFWADKAEISVPVVSGTSGEAQITY